MAIHLALDTTLCSHVPVLINVLFRESTYPSRVPTSKIEQENHARQLNQQERAQNYQRIYHPYAPLFRAPPMPAHRTAPGTATSSAVHVHVSPLRHFEIFWTMKRPTSRRHSGM